MFEIDCDIPENTYFCLKYKEYEKIHYFVGSTIGIWMSEI